VVQDWSHIPTMPDIHVGKAPVAHSTWARLDAADPGTGVYDATRMHARALARQPFCLSPPPSSQVQPTSLPHVGQPVIASTGKRVPGGRVAQASEGASNVTSTVTSSVTSSVMSRHPLHLVATRAALSREAGVSKTKAKGAMGSLVVRRLAKPLPNPPLSNRRSPGTAARANKRVREAVRRRSGPELDGNQLHGALVQPGSPPPSATQARQAGSTASPRSKTSATRGRQPAPEKPTLL
jgi:hypothetical protein